MLRTNVTDWTPDELWRTNIQLTDARAGLPDPKGVRTLEDPRVLPTEQTRTPAALRASV